MLKEVTVYKNAKGEIIGSLLIDFLRNGEFCREEETVSFWDGSKSSYIFGLTVPKETKEITRNIAPRFVND